MNSLVINAHSQKWNFKVEKYKKKTREAPYTQFLQQLLLVHILLVPEYPILIQNKTTLIPKNRFRR